MTTAAHPLLPPAGATVPVWRVLDARLDCGRLLDLWQAWLEQAPHCRVLHLVALCEAAPTAAQVRAAARAAQRPLALELAEACWGLLPGMHRLSLHEGRLQLTLCVGDAAALLREQRFEADALWLDADPPCPLALLQALARCSRRGAVLAGLSDERAALAPALRQAGFVWQAGCWRFDPPWPLRREAAARAAAPPPGRCAVVGAGLAGASVAAALARRGWQVQVLDAAAEPASGASGLPVGLLIPYASANDSPRARLTRAGLRLMRAEAQRLLRAGEDWGPGGVLELRLDGRGGLPPHWPAAGADISRAHEISGEPPWQAGLLTRQALWHAPAAWLKPAQLVRAWLATPGVQFLGQRRVQTLQARSGGWALLDAKGRLLAEAEQLVLANALDAPRLLASVGVALAALHGMRGVLSWGLHGPALEAVCPPHPVNGAGSFIPGVPTAEGLAWYAGSTYEASDGPAAPVAEHLQADWAKLQRLLPAAAAALAPDYAAGRVRGWEALRCVSRDRLPLAGPLLDDARPSLWISAAMGSRGLSLAMLCAELLAAQLGDEPWPVPARLARHLHPRRHPAAAA